MVYSFTPKIFISYCTRCPLSVQFGDLLKKRLEENGFETFLDRSSLEGGDNFVNRIREAISFDCHGGILLLSRAAMNSNWVVDEAVLLMARKQWVNKLIIVPALIPPVKSVEQFFGERSRLWQLSDLQGVVVAPDWLKNLGRLLGHRVIFYALSVVRLLGSVRKSGNDSVFFGQLDKPVARIIKILTPLKSMDFEGKKLPLAPFVTLKNAQGVQRLDPRARFLPLIGRESELQELDGWLEGKKPISVRGMIGDAGRGKTRLAMELVQIVQKQGWHAGFLSSEMLEKLVTQGESGWSRPTLAVIDDAASHAIHPKMAEAIGLLPDADFRKQENHSITDFAAGAGS
ncbi:MAG: toll/interleukin-1 receptor domain-containing protein [Magnetococcus sp. DMHC-1]